MGEFIDMIEYAHIPKDDNMTMFHYGTLFDRKEYKKFIEDFAHDIVGQPFIWLIISGTKHAYKIKNNNELIHVLAYINNTLIRDPLATTAVKVPVMPPVVPNLQPLQPPQGVVVLETPIKFNVV
jgi:hypothetical protein